MRNARSGLMTAVAAGVASLLIACGSSGTSGSTAGNGQSTTKPAPALPTPFTITARYSAKSLGIDAAAELAIGPDGNLYVTDISERMSVISPNGKVVHRWGKPGNGPGEFKFTAADPSDPKGINAALAIGPHGMVYVADGNARVQVFTAQGRLVRQFGSFGSGRGQFLSAPDVVVDTAGNVYTADGTAHYLAKFTPDGKLVWEIGASTDSDPDLAGSLHLAAIDGHGRLVAANDDAYRVVYVDRDGHKVDAFGSSSDFPGRACDTTVDAFGYVYVTGCGSSSSCIPASCATLVFDRTHGLVAKWPGTKDPLHHSPMFAASGEAFALGLDGSVVKLHITLPRR